MQISKNFHELSAALVRRVVNALLPFAGLKAKFEEHFWVVTEVDVLVYEKLPNGLKVPRPDLSYSGHNLVTDVGRQQVLKFILNITDPAPPVSGFPYLGVGDGVTAADPGDVDLESELVGNAARKTLKNTSDVDLSDSDIVAEVSGAFRWKVVAQATYDDDTDGNNGSDFAEWAIFSSDTFGAGEMYNRYVHPSPFTKSASLSVVARLTLRA